jgi:hypothetical protein
MGRLHVIAMTSCPHCRAPLNPGATVCSYCGATVAAAPPLQPPQPQAAWPPPPFPGAMPWVPPRAGQALPYEPEPAFIAWAVVNFMLFIFFGNVFSAPGAILALLARSSWASGQRDKARGQLRLAQGLTFGGALLGVLILVAFVVFVVLAESL